MCSEKVACVCECEESMKRSIFKLPPDSTTIERSRNLHGARARECYEYIFQIKKKLQKRGKFLNCISAENKRANWLHSLVRMHGGRRRQRLENLLQSQ
jgi:hypothetical protein